MAKTSSATTSTAEGQIEILGKLLIRARVFFDAWKLSGGVDGKAQFREFWDEYWEYWRFNEHALLFSFIVHMAGLFEKRDDTINFHSVWNSQKDTDHGRNLSAEMALLFKKAARAAKGVIIIRSNAMAHRSANLNYNEAFKKANVTPDQLSELTDTSLAIVNKLRGMFDLTELQFDDGPLDVLKRLATTKDQRVMDRRYHINLFWSPRDACWVADVPDLKPCSAFGDTPEEALAEARDAIDGWIETALANNMAVPEPRYRPAIYASAA